MCGCVHAALLMANIHMHTWITLVNFSFVQGGDLAGTLFDSLGLPDTLTSGDVAILFSAASTLLTTENINNNTVSCKPALLSSLYEHKMCIKHRKFF